MVAEARLEETDAGLVPATVGWFVMNARDARWRDQPGRGHSLPLTGADEYEAETFFPMLGMAIRVVNPGEPTDTYHWETEQEDFLVLSGEALLIVEGQERRLRQWDFVHCRRNAARVRRRGRWALRCCARVRDSSRRTARGATTAPMRPPPATARAARGHAGQRARLRAISPPVPARYREALPNA